MERVGHQVQYDPHNNLFERPGNEAFAKLFSAEEDFMVQPSYFNNGVKKALRRIAVEMIESLHTATSSNSDALIPYTAMTYFDQYLSRKSSFPLVTRSFGGNTRLFVICCLTLAWKLRHKSFNLSVFLSERSLAYSTEDVLKMELEICRGLQWRMITLTPFCFIEFFIPVLRLPPNSPSPRRSVRELIVRSQCDIAFTEFRPSVMAVSAMLIVSSKLFPAQHSLFEIRVTTDVEPLRLLKDMILKCIKQLDPLYKNPDDMAITIEGGPVPGSSPQTQPEPPEEATSVHRLGKERATTSQLAAADQDELMDFDLGWIELLEAADMRDGSGRVVSWTYIVEGIAKCWIEWATACEDIKNKTGGLCNIQ